MGNNEDRKPNKSEYFELREKRLKLVYKILYVIVAIWIAILICVSQTILKKEEIPIYAFLLSASSMVIIQIIKYAIMEFRCMKIIGPINDEIMKQTEIRYDNIWASFPLILSLCGFATVIHHLLAGVLDKNAFLIIFSIGVVYFTTSSVIDILNIFKKGFKDVIVKVLDIIGIVVGAFASYSLCAAACLIASSVVSK